MKLRTVYGDPVVAQALEIAREAEQRDRMSISGRRRRRQRENTTARQTQQLFQRKDHDKPSPRPMEPLAPLPYGWR